MSRITSRRAFAISLRLVGGVLLAGATVIAVACQGGMNSPVAPDASGAAPAESWAPASPATAPLSVAARGQVESQICHRMKGGNSFIPIWVAEPAVGAHLAHGDGRIGDRVPGQDGMKFSTTCTSVPSGVVTLTFASLTDNGAPFTGYSQDGFSVSPVSGNWVALSTYGHPLPSIIFNRLAAQPTITAEVRIVREGGAAFRFNVVDLYSSTTTIPYVFVGSLGALQVFSVAGEQGNTFGDFVPVPNPNSADTIDALLIRLSNPTSDCCDNPVGLDNIVVSYDP